MIVDFMQNFSPAEYLHKQFNVLLETNCTILEPCDILNPVFILDYQSVLTQCNYAYVEEFGRYYFARTEIANGNRIYVYCTVDPLQSWQQQIESLYVNVNLSEYQNRSYVPDQRILMENAIDMRTIAFPFELGNSDFSGVHYMMTVIGGVSSPATDEG